MCDMAAKYPKTFALVQWALKKAKVEEEEFLADDGTLCRVKTKMLRGNIGKRLAPIADELGLRQLVLFVNEELHTVSFERLNKYNGDFGKFLVCESIFEPVR